MRRLRRRVDGAVWDANGPIDPEQARAFAFVGRSCWKVGPFVDGAVVPGPTSAR